MTRINTILRNTIWAIASTAIGRLSMLLRSEQGETAAPKTERLAPKAIDGSTISALDSDQSGSPEKLVAVLPLIGVLEARGPAWLEEFGFVMMDRWARRFNDLVANDRVGAIVLDIDSPGGSVYGVTEAARAIFAARGTKPIIAVANPQAASAAYYMAAAADEIVMTVSAEVGSVGTVAVHLDLSKADEMAGLTWTIIKEGKFKWEANDMQPLSDDAREFIEKRVHDYYALFTGDLKKFRKDATIKAPRDFGGGRMYGAADAVEMGLADRVATLDEVAMKLAEKLNKTRSRASARAALAAL